jgi:hypothetical protein
MAFFPKYLLCVPNIPKHPKKWLRVAKPTHQDDESLLIFVTSFGLAGLPSQKKDIHQQMKKQLVVFFILCSINAQAQIDYSHFYQTWSRCLPDSGKTETDTLRFMSSDLKNECRTTWLSESLIHHSNLRYSFFPNDSMTIYRDEGNSLRPDYVPDTAMTVVLQSDTVLSSSGRMTIVVRENVIKVPIRVSSTGSAATMSMTYYRLNRETNRLNIAEGDADYEILRLTRTELVLRRK